MGKEISIDNSLPWFLLRDSQKVYVQPVQFVVVDFETTNLSKGSALDEKNEIVLACWKVVYPDGSSRDFHKFGGEYNQHELLQAIASAKFVVAQNAKFELQWLKRCGLDLRGVLVFDTLLGAWVLDGNLTRPRHLNALADRYGIPHKESLVALLIDQGICPSEIPRSWLLKYCARDVETTWEVFKRIASDLETSNRLHLVHTRNLTCAMLADIEFNGMTLDPVAVEEEYYKTLKERNEAENELHTLAEGVNLNSGKQLAEFLYGKLGFTPPKDHKGKVIKTKGGAYATDADTLSLLKATTPEQERFVALYKRYNQLDSLLTKNLSFFFNVVKERNCTFTAQFNQAITATHRLSSSGRPITFSDGKTRSTQFQNMPRAYKRLFTSGDDDYEIGECDSAQLEFRVAVELGHDSTGLGELVEGADVHGNTSRVLTEAGEPTDRQDSKPITFTPLFGGVGISKAQKAYAIYFKEHYHELGKEQAEWVLKVADKKELTTPLGMVYYWPNATMNRYGYVNVNNQVMNYPIQGTATGEIIPIAAVHFWHRIKNTGILLLNTIHDSLISKVPKGLGELFERLSFQCLTLDVYDFLRDVYGYEWQTPLGVGIKLSRNWGYTKNEVSYQVYPDGRYERKAK